jgi:hypothetical protein
MFRGSKKTENPLLLDITRNKAQKGEGIRNNKPENERDEENHRLLKLRICVAKPTPN